MDVTWYQIATIIISFLSLFGFGFVMKYFWQDRHDRKKQNSEETRNRIKDENKEETRQVFREEMQPLIETINQIKSLSTTTSTGTVTLLRDRMKSALNAYRKQQWANSSDKANWFELYNTYKTMGGNHFREYVDQWKQELDILPCEEEFKKAKAAKNKSANG